MATTSFFSKRRKMAATDFALRSRRKWTCQATSWIMSSWPSAERRNGLHAARRPAPALSFPWPGWPYPMQIFFLFNVWKLFVFTCWTRQCCQHIGMVFLCHHGSRCWLKLDTFGPYPPDASNNCNHTLSEQCDGIRKLRHLTLPRR